MHNYKKFATHEREPFFEIAKEVVSKGDRILDIGAGNGNFANFCEIEDIYLLDGNQKSVEYLKTKFRNVTLGNLPTLPYDSNFFDLIHMSHVIEHLHPHEVYDTIKEMERCCKTGGVLVISAPLLWDGFYDDLSHVKPYNPFIFQKYLCAGSHSELTREKISDQFVVERLQYRFQERVFFYGIKKSKKLTHKILYRFYKFLQSKGVTRYQKTGYTIVLRKKAKVN